MAVLSLCFSLLFALTALGLRAWWHTRRTGRQPLRRGAGVSGMTALAATAAAFTAGPIVDLGTGRGRLVHGPVPAVLGVAVAVLGLALTLWSQAAMGDAWRIGVDPTERTRLVVAGPFRWVRNPIYTAMIAFSVGLALLVPNAASALGVVFVVAALELHVRRVEEPHLSGTFTVDYQTYAGHVGRFVPGIGRLANS